jgi:hypothetical protein
LYESSQLEGVEPSRDSRGQSVAAGIHQALQLPQEAPAFNNINALVFMDVRL